MKLYLCRLPLLAIFPFLFLSCNEPEEAIVHIAPASTVAEESTHYIIKSGVHETTNPIKGLQTNSLRFEVTFDATAIYQTKDPSNQADINKLYGMSDCSSFHHQNSARFGWRWYNNRLELLAYSYKEGVNTSTFITAVDLNKTYTCELALVGNKYIYKVGETTVEHVRKCDGEGIGYQLYPYFGGDETAPHEINIKIKVLK